jgi:hypothetical protein
MKSCTKINLCVPHSRRGDSGTTDQLRKEVQKRCCLKTGEVHCLLTRTTVQIVEVRHV